MSVHQTGSDDRPLCVQNIIGIILSDQLGALSDLYKLAASLFGKSFAEARSTLTAGNYAIEQVMSIFGTQLASVEDPALDDRKVIQVVPMELGVPGVLTRIALKAPP